MRRRNNIWVAFILCSVAQVCAAQDTLTLSHGEFLSIVKRFHPLSLQYKLQNEIARSELRKAKGNFDPLLAAKSGSKTIDGTDYYQQHNIGVEIPTWYGIELNGNYNYLEGERLNNNDTKGGLYQFGLSIPLSKNLLYDKRRAVLDQARFALSMTTAQQQVLNSELLRDAEIVYWDWVKCYEIYKIQKHAVAINKKRLHMIQKSFDYGERAAVDTTEALSQLMAFELEQQDAYLKFVNATMVLSLYLWKDKESPFDTTSPILPSDTLDSNSAYTDFLSLTRQLNVHPINTHLSLVYYQDKQKILESERRLKWQNFLPKIDFSYNFFKKERYSSTLLPLFQNNFQYGLKMEIPLFMRQARADYSIAKMKIVQNDLDIQVKRRELNTKIQRYSNEVSNYRAQLDIAIQNIINYKRLLKAEETRYDNGESSLFLINTRENKVIEAQEKALDLQFKFMKSYNELKLIAAGFSSDSQYAQ